MSGRVVFFGNSIELPVLAWWAALNVCTLFQVYAWATTAPEFDGPLPALSALSAWLVNGDSSYRKDQWMCAGIYTAVCAFRALLPRIDAERRVLFQHPLSAIALGRAWATVAEIVFGVQCAMALLQLHLSTTEPLPFASRLVVDATVIGLPIAVTVAQGFCWYSVLTTTNMGHAIEETLWGFAYACLLVALCVLYPYLPETHLVYAQVGIAVTAVYVAFMALVDVPMYLHRAKENAAAKNHGLGLAAGFADCCVRRVSSVTFAEWGPEMPWLTGYFVGAVFLSQQMVWIP